MLPLSDKYKKCVDAVQNICNFDQLKSISKDKEPQNRSQTCPAKKAKMFRN